VELERNSNVRFTNTLWKGALAAAERVRNQYEDTAPWDDFEWGKMLKRQAISRLRWVIGVNGNMLDT